MKTLFTLLLIICSLQGFGQEIDTANYVNSLIISSCNGLIPDINFPAFRNYQSVLIEDSGLSVDGKRLITVNDILGYADECSKDSVQTYGFGICIIDTLSYTYDLYKPKEPTFSGFIEWVKNKGK